MPHRYQNNYLSGRFTSKQAVNSSSSPGGPQISLVEYIGGFIWGLMKLQEGPLVHNIGLECPKKSVRRCFEGLENAFCRKGENSLKESRKQAGTELCQAKHS